MWFWYVFNLWSKNGLFCMVVFKFWLVSFNLNGKVVLVSVKVDVCGIVFGIFVIV